MIHLYTGDGKGKTTAAYGLALRMQGQGGRVCVIRFLKSGGSGEVVALSSLKNVYIYTLEKAHDFFYNLKDSEKEQLKGEVASEFDLACQILAKKSCELLVLDEVIDAVNLGLVDADRLLALLSSADKTEVVLTGRNPAEKICDAADYHTDFRALKHPYNSGTAARRGIEY